MLERSSELTMSNIYNRRIQEQIEDIETDLQDEFAFALDELLESPRPQSILAILNYARQSAQ